MSYARVYISCRCRLCGRQINVTQYQPTDVDVTSVNRSAIVDDAYNEAIDVQATGGPTDCGLDDTKHAAD